MCGELEVKLRSHNFCLRRHVDFCVFDCNFCFLLILLCSPTQIAIFAGKAKRDDKMEVKLLLTVVANVLLVAAKRPTTPTLPHILSSFLLTIMVMVTYVGYNRHPSDPARSEVQPHTQHRCLGHQGRKELS